MKIAIAYLPEEGRGAGTIETFIKRLMPGAKIRKSDRHAPFMHIYITTREQLQNRKTVAAVGESEKEESPCV